MSGMRPTKTPAIAIRDSVDSGMVVDVRDGQSKTANHATVQSLYSHLLAMSMARCDCSRPKRQCWKASLCPEQTRLVPFGAHADGGDLNQARMVR